MRVATAEATAIHLLSLLIRLQLHVACKMHSTDSMPHGMRSRQMLQAKSDATSLPHTEDRSRPASAAAFEPLLLSRCAAGCAGCLCRATGCNAMAVRRPQPPSGIVRRCCRRSFAVASQAAGDVGDAGQDGGSPQVLRRGALRLRIFITLHSGDKAL